MGKHFCWRISIFISSSLFPRTAGDQHQQTGRCGKEMGRQALRAIKIKGNVTFPASIAPAAERLVSSSPPG